MSMYASIVYKTTRQLKLERVQKNQETTQATQHHQCILTIVQPQFYKVVQVTKVKCEAEPAIV